MMSMENANFGDEDLEMLSLLAGHLSNPIIV